MSLTHPLLTIEAADEPGVYVIRVEGELDRVGMPDLESVLADAELSQSDRIVLDLDGLSFIDAGGLRMLVGAASLSEQWQPFEPDAGHRRGGAHVSADHA